MMAANGDNVKNQLITANDKAKHAFFNDMSPEEAQKWFDTLVPHSQDAFETGVDFVAADLTIPKAYVICELDQVSWRCRPYQPPKICFC